MDFKREQEANLEKRESKKDRSILMQQMIALGKTPQEIKEMLKFYSNEE